MDVRQLQEMCFVMLVSATACVILFLLSFRHFESTANFCACQTADVVLRGHKTSDRSETFCDYMSSRSKADPV